MNTTRKIICRIGDFFVGVGRFFIPQPPEVTSTLAALDVFERRFFFSLLKGMVHLYADKRDIPYDADFGHQLFDIIRRGVTKHKKLTVRKVSEQRHHPEIYALMVIISVTSSLLKSGQYQSSQGIHSNEGEMLKALQIFAMRELEDSDEFDYKAERFLEEQEEADQTSWRDYW